MGIFKSEGIIIKIQKYSEKEFLYKVFFYEYGILTVKKKKNNRDKALDVGYRANSEIFTQGKSKIHSIGSIKILDFFQSLGRPYSEIELFMKIISYISKQLPEGYPNKEIYESLCVCIQSHDAKKYQILLLCFIKIQFLCGEIEPNSDDMHQKKILRFAQNNNISTIIKLSLLPENTINKLKQHLYTVCK